MQASTVLPLSITAYIIKEDGGSFQYLMLRRCSKHFFGNWQPVTGRIEADETAWQAALREIEEETQLQPNRFYVAEIVEVFYEVYLNAVVTVPVFVAFVDAFQEVIPEPKEHDAYEWVPFEKALTLLNFAEHKRSIKTVHESFIEQQPNEMLRIHFSKEVALDVPANSL